MTKMGLWNGETSLGGNRRDFPTTQWSAFLQGDMGDQSDSWGAFLESYWKPVYVYLRAQWAKSNEDAKDLTQDFMIWMMEGDFLTRPDPTRGRFRTFLKVALHNFVCDRERKQHTVRREGRKHPLILSTSPHKFGPS